jgi:hypothetical protein
MMKATEDRLPCDLAKPLNGTTEPRILAEGEMRLQPRAIATHSVTQRKM